ncbi:MAG: ABC transporter permease [bacterium]|nr:ABC transporter permease [bacterium]
MNVFKVAWRNVWRNKRRSIVTIAAMTFALWVELLYSGLIVGFMQGMERDVLDLEFGDLQIFAGDYLDTPSIYTAIDAPELLLAKLDGLGYPASARLLGGGLAAAGEYSAGVAFRGLDVERDAGVSLIHEQLAEGEWLDPAEAYGVVVGRRLARTLDVGPGDELVVLTQAADGSMANELYTVRGVLLGVAEGTDRTAVFMNAEAFRELMVFPERVHQIIVRRPDEVELETAAAEVRSLAPELDVKTWRELMPIIASMLDSTQAMTFTIFFIVYIAVAILILNAMLMAVFERIREFGVLKALGMSPLRVVNLIFVESAIQTAIAIVVGGTLAVPGMWYLRDVGIDVGMLGGTDMMGVAMRPIWYGVYDAGTISGPLLMLVVIVLLAVLYPALKAAWIRPVAAMRHQ